MALFKILLLVGHLFIYLFILNFVSMLNFMSMLTVFMDDTQ